MLIAVVYKTSIMPAQSFGIAEHRSLEKMLQDHILVDGLKALASSSSGLSIMLQGPNDPSGVLLPALVGEEYTQITQKTSRPNS